MIISESSYRRSQSLIITGILLVILFSPSLTLVTRASAVASSFGTLGGGAPLISGVSLTWGDGGVGGDGATDVYTNPTLSIQVNDPEGDLMNITFRTNATGTWEDIETYYNVGNGKYSVIPMSMNKLSTKYHWGVSVTDGSSWSDKTYRFTTTTTILDYKWISQVRVGKAAAGVLIADINGDGLEEVIHAGAGPGGVGVVKALRGTDGSQIWSQTVQDIHEMVQIQMADLNKDGILDVVIPLGHGGVEVLHGNDGSRYWRVTGLGGECWNAPVVADIDGDGYPTVFYCSTDAYNGLNGSGRVTALSHDGRILYRTWAFRPCAGGLSIADTDNDGEFELYQGDRDMYGLGYFGRACRSFWARNLTLRWDHPDILMSSNKPMLVDVNDDGILDVICGYLYGGIAILNSADGSAIKKDLDITLSDGETFPVHYSMSVHDLDGDGNLELVCADGDREHEWTSKDVAVWDLIDWKEEAIIDLNGETSWWGPTLADVTGDGKMEIIVCTQNTIQIYNSTYQRIAIVMGLRGTLRYAVVQDIDGDGYNELVVSNWRSLVNNAYDGDVYAYDTPARRPTPRARTEVEFYSERRVGAAEYVPPPGRPTPVISAPSPADGASDMPVSLTGLSFNLSDFQYDPMNYTVVISPDIGSGSGTNVGYGKQTVPVNLDYSTTYTWQVNVTDGVHSESKTFSFTTETAPPGAPRVSDEAPRNRATHVPTSLSELRFRLSDPQGEPMDYSVVTSPDIGSGSGTNVGAGTYTVPVSGLAYSTTYTWHVNVTDGTNWNNRTYTFTTQASTPPTHDEPVLDMADGGLVCRNQTTMDPDGDAVTNIYHWYRNGISWTSLILPFDTNDNRTVKDYSGYGNDGTVVGEAAWTSNGVVGGAYNFSGDRPGGGYIIIPHSSSLDGGRTWSELTVEHWIYPMFNNEETRTIAKVPSYEIGLEPYSSGQATVYAGIWTASTDPTTPWETSYRSVSYRIYYNRWYHVAFTYKSGDRLRLYVNGVLCASTSRSGNIQRSSGSAAQVPLYIGWHDHFRGMIDEVRIYPGTSLSADQIYRRYLETKDGASNNSTIVSQEVKRGDEWKCEVIPNDSHYDGTTRMSNILTVTNRPPHAENVAMGPRARDTALTTDTLVGSYDYVDWDGDPESGTEVRWYKNGALQTELNDTLEVSSSFTAVGDVWYFTVRPSDGIDFGNLQTSSSVTILQNSPPTHDDPILRKTLETNPTAENLVCSNQTTMDPDGGRDMVTNIYSWQRNGTPWANLLLPFDTENWTVVRDYSGYGNDGTVKGATWTEYGVVGGAYVFDGNDGISISDDRSLDGDGTWSEITIELWIKPTANQRGSRIILKNPSTGSGSYMIGFQTSTSRPYNVLFWYVTISGSSSEIEYSTPLEVGEWYHVVCTYKSGYGLTMYINGTEVSHVGRSGNIDVRHNQPLYIGWNELDPTRYYIGVIDEVRIYPRSLSAEQILQRYLETKDGASNSSTVVWEETRVGDVWRCEVTPTDSFQDGTKRATNPVTVFSVPTTLLMPFDTDASPTAVDYSGYGNNGTAYGATWTDYGLGGGAYYFDGGGDYIRVPDDSSLDGDGGWSGLTVELWVFPTARQSGKIIMQKGANFTQMSYEVGIQKSKTRNLLYCAVWAADRYEVRYAVPLERYAWYHVALTYNGSRVTLYVNGTEVGNVAGSGNVRDSSPYPVYIGARYGTRDFFTGIVDEVRIYPVSLSAEQILQHWVNP